MPNMKEIILSGLALLCAGCVLATSAQDSAGYHSPQGRHMIGGNLQSLVVATSAAVGADQMRFDALQIRQAQLVGLRGKTEHSAAAPLLVGATLRGTVRGEIKDEPVQLQIVRICPHARPPLDWATPAGWSLPAGCVVPPGWRDGSGDGEYEYEVLYRKTDGEPWSPLCDPSWNRALPAAGIWSIPDAAYKESASTFTFACPDGVVAKCLNWGYRPWEHRDLHQACTRMARADYCATGLSHTVEGTIIGMTDRFGIRKDSASLAPESSWMPDGVARCLSRKRWNSLPPGGPKGCNGKLKDPRVDSTARYCEDLNSFKDDLLINSSTLLDIGIYLWTSNDDSFTTSHFRYDRAELIEPPGPEYDKVAFAGSVYRADIDESKQEGTVPLVSYVGPAGDHLTTTQAPPAGYTRVDKEAEGRVFPPERQVEGFAGLHTWRQEKTGRHVTSGDADNWGPPACEKPGPKEACVAGSRHKPENGFVYLRLEGYLPTLNLR